MSLGLWFKFENEELRKNKEMLRIMSVPRSNRDTHLL